MLHIPGLDAMMEEMRGFQSDLLGIMGEMRDTLNEINEKLEQE